MAKKKNYHVTPTGAVGTNTASAMLALAQKTGTTAPGTYQAQGGQVVPVPKPPLDPVQEAQNVSNQRNLGISQAQSAYDTGRIENEYGLGMDKSNPYSRAALLQENYRRAQRGTTNSYASQGQLYSGAYQRMQGENTRNYSIADDRLRRDYADSLHGVQLGQLQSYANYGTGQDSAAYEALLRAFRGG